MTAVAEGVEAGKHSSSDPPAPSSHLPISRLLSHAAEPPLSAVYPNKGSGGRNVDPARPQSAAMFGGSAPRPQSAAAMLSRGHRSPGSLRYSVTPVSMWELYGGGSGSPASRRPSSSSVPPGERGSGGGGSEASATQRPSSSSTTTPPGGSGGRPPIISAREAMLQERAQWNRQRQQASSLQCGGTIKEALEDRRGSDGASGSPCSGERTWVGVSSGQLHGSAAGRPLSAMPATGRPLSSPSFSARGAAGTQPQPASGSRPASAAVSWSAPSATRGSDGAALRRSGAFPTAQAVPSGLFKSRLNY